MEVSGLSQGAPKTTSQLQVLCQRLLRFLHKFLQFACHKIQANPMVPLLYHGFGCALQQISALHYILLLVAVSRDADRVPSAPCVRGCRSPDGAQRV